ncbi:MAG: hypothetical protein RL323_282 [Pseudomonadota bacterium]
MKIRHLLLGLALTGSAMTLTVGGIGFWVGSRLTSGISDAVLASTAVADSGNADMMHDAIRADVLAAIVAAQQGDLAGVEAASKDLESDGQRLIELLTNLESLNLGNDVKQLFTAALPVAKAYVATGKQVQAGLITDGAAALAQLPKFTQAFETLEVSLAEPGERIQAFAKTTEVESLKVAGQSKWYLLGATVVATALLLALCAFVMRRILTGLSLAGRVANTVAGGDLSQKVSVTGEAEVLVLLQALEDMRLKLADLTGRAYDMADSVAAASGQIAQGNEDLAQRNDNQLQSIQATSRAMQQLSSAVEQNADNAALASRLSLDTSTVAVRGGSEVSEVVSTMQGIAESSRKISDIISVIDGIAFQTNILALNAAVEAARAGEAGRGFAVVASEVRNLAGRSADAAKEIKQLILASVQRVEHGNLLVDRAGATMNEVVDSVRRVTELMTEISASTQEQKLAIASVSEAATALEDSSQQNASLVEESAAAAASLSDLSQSLVQLVSFFHSTGTSHPRAGNVPRLTH